jgi:hypothetical protein
MKKIYSLLLLSLLYIPANAMAESRIFDPNVNKGEVTIDANGEFQEDNGKGLVLGDRNFYRGEVDYGVTDSFGLGVIGLGGDSNGNYEHEATGVQATFQFAEQTNENPVASAFRIEYDLASKSSVDDNISGLLLFAHKGAKWDYRLDVGLDYGDTIGSNDKDASGDIRASIDYVLSPMFRPGVEYYNNSGSISNFDFDNQVSTIGPVIYGDLPYNFSYEVGYLFGLSDNTPDSTVKGDIKYHLKLN